jgi:NAD(P)-dependent dehydrogenase (short-subunit alcohol dehydrogenase family)
MGPNASLVSDHGEDSYQGSGLLDGKVALVTGGASGIGRAISIAYAREGADLAIGFLDDHEAAEETMRLVKAVGRQALLIPGDIGTEAFCRAMVDETIDRFGRLDILVNNAAYQKAFDSIEEISTDDWERIFRVNIHAPFHLAKAAARHMQPGSVIINTSSLQAKNPSPELLAYASTKGALSTFTAALAQMLAGRGIRVNAVAPGPIWTPLIPGSLSEDAVEAFGKDTPLGRPGQPGELAGLYVLLASGRSSYVTGAVFAATGGIPML